MKHKKQGGKFVEMAMKSVVCLAGSIMMLGTPAEAQVKVDGGVVTDSATFVKTGFSFGVLPAVSYDSDLGFQYGLLTNLYWYGDGSKYPQYEHSLYLECSRYAAGTMLARAYYDSPVLLSGISDNLRLTADVTWFRDLLMDFAGFNGRQSVYNERWTDSDDSEYKTRVFYNHHRTMFRTMATVRGDIPERHLYWLAGITFFNMDIEGVHRDELKRSTPEGVPTLYELYCKYGVIREEEKDGGADAFIRASIGVDLRDSEAFPTKGVWSEMSVAAAPGFMSKKTDGFLRLTLFHRQYFRLGSDNRVFAVRLMAQNRIAGRVPFYLLPHITTATLGSATSQGLGGAKTMRGVARNRIVGDGVAMANVEYRWILKRFQWLGAQWAVGTNIFGDFGITTQDYKVDMAGVPDEERSMLFRTGDDCIHSSVGMGLKLHFNTNFIVSCDYGKPLRKDDGTKGLYIQLNYLF
ncbi:MAG: BamA/TamA family outer membrane protein [Bacteroidales bacterium]|nr:BamA/TamA family outer membrane protein [Bacteroidales bacterium]